MRGCSAATAPSAAYCRNVRTTPIHPPVDLSLPQIATSPRPADQYSVLRARGVHCRDGAWVVARPEDVDAALTIRALSVTPPDASFGDATRLQTRMARFSDGADHARRRGLTEALLAGVSNVEKTAAAQTEAIIRDRPCPFDLMPLARTVPVAVLAAALGIPPADIARIVALTGQLCDALSPSLAARSPSPDADLAARNLVSLLEPAGPWDEEQVAAAAGVLFQARDATAALIGAAVLGDDHEIGDVGQRIDRALRQDAPVQCTRRYAVDEVVLGDVTVPKGSQVWVMLAAAERGASAPPATFGAGPHACPGSSLAIALARGVVTAVRRRGLRPVPGQRVEYEARPNLRLPAHIWMARS